jgi:hypothetical protein
MQCSLEAMRNTHFFFENLKGIDNFGDLGDSYILNGFKCMGLENVDLFFSASCRSGINKGENSKKVLEFIEHVREQILSTL